MRIYVIKLIISVLDASRGFIKLHDGDVSLSDMHIVYIFSISFFNLIYVTLDLTSKASSSQQAGDQSFIVYLEITQISAFFLRVC